MKKTKTRHNYLQRRSVFDPKKTTYALYALGLMLVLKKTLFSNFSMRDKRKLKVAKEWFPVFGSNGGTFSFNFVFFSKKVKKPEQLTVSSVHVILHCQM